MKKLYPRPVTIFGAACLAAVLAAPLAGCSDRPDEQPAADQPKALELAREKEAERRPGTEDAETGQADVEYAEEGYAKPRESWTGGGTARDAGFTDVAETDARAMQQVKDVLAAREGFGQVNVEVTDGIAHLTGEVESWLMKQEAENIVMALEGVVEVRNDLEVSAEGGS